MIKRKQGILFVLGFLVWILPIFSQDLSQKRSLCDLFPGLSEEQQTEALGEGIIRMIEKGGNFALSPAPDSGIDLSERIISKGHPYRIESILVVPYGEKDLDTLAAYNALGKVRNLKGLLYHSHTRNQDVPLFEEASRMVSAERNTPISDPEPAASLPKSETVYIRLKDTNFGNSYYRAEINPEERGLLYSLTNYKTIYYFIFSVMDREKFSAFLYMEPLAEGMLVYSVAGTDVSNFIAGNIDVPSAIGKRLAVFVDWIRGGLEGR